MLRTSIELLKKTPYAEICARSSVVVPPLHIWRLLWHQALAWYGHILPANGFCSYISMPSSHRSKIWRMRGISCPAGCHDDDNVHLAWHGIITEVLVACELVRAPLCRSLLLRMPANFRRVFFIFLFLYFICIVMVSFATK